MTNYYNMFKAVPAEACRTINAGNLKGFTDINPMWRIKMLTEAFGPCGIGWYTEITKQWLESGEDGKVAAFCNINLYIKVDGEWSKPIVGTGGSCFVNLFKGNPATSDEAYKMAYTDALSVACKALGMGADIYWSEGRTKYVQEVQKPVQEVQKPVQNAPEKPSEPQEAVEAPKVTKYLSDKEIMVLESLAAQKGIAIEQICARYKVNNLGELTGRQYVSAVKAIEKSGGKA